MRYSLFKIILILIVGALHSQTRADVLINEIAWMGTTNSVYDEWIELHNNGKQLVNLDGWVLEASDGSPVINLSGVIPANGFYLLERQDDNTVLGIAADQIYSGVLENSGQVLELKNAQGVVVDSVNYWYAGDNATKATMERTPYQGVVWETSISTYTGGLGTPKAINSKVQPPIANPGSLNTVSEKEGAINVYFNKSALTDYAIKKNKANYNVNLEQRLLQRIAQATQRIDMATYELNLPNIVDALIDKASTGVSVRIIADAKDPSDPDHILRYETMCLYLEKLVRGADGQVGTADDSHLFSDSVIFAIEDPAQRLAMGLPEQPTGLVQRSVTVGSQPVSGYFLVDGERKPDNQYYSPGNQMHNKFLIIDNNWVWTGSWNFTVTGLYGSEEDRRAGRLSGNTQHAIEINSTELAAAYKIEFDEMWGASGNLPDPNGSNFHSRKTDNTPHNYVIDGRSVELYFSPGDDAIGQVTNYVQQHSDQSVQFSIFAWSDQTLTDVLKQKWEGSTTDLTGTRTGFVVEGLFDSSFWNQWWSASIDMTGRTASRTSTNNPNTRWANPAPVYTDMEARKLHSKTMIIDACSNSDPSVVVGSTNWSTNGNDINDENLLIIHDALIANQFLQEFYARYQQAGGNIVPLDQFTCVRQ